MGSAGSGARAVCSGGRGVETPPLLGLSHAKGGDSDVSPETSPRQFQWIKRTSARAPDARARACACVSAEQGVPTFLVGLNPIPFHLYICFLFVFFLSGKEHLFGKQIIQQTAPDSEKEFVLPRACPSRFPRQTSAACAVGQ